MRFDFAASAEDGETSMRTADFDYPLPAELIAQTPAAERGGSRLLVLERGPGTIQHRQFSDLAGFLRAGDVLVLNDSKVIPARLRGRNAKSMGEFEILLLEENSTNDWWAMLKPGKRGRLGTEITVLSYNKEPTGISATVSEINAEGHRRLQFSGVANVFDTLATVGEVPLPPYIQREKPFQEDWNRYQTVYAQSPGSVAAPTAGLHFTSELLGEIERRGVELCFVTLHVGPGTFAPVKAATVSEHVMHEERFEVPEETARTINTAKAEKRRVIAVGTTTVRVLETLAKLKSPIAAGPGRTSIFLFPPAEFRVVDALVTNFHLPCSTLLMLVSAFAAPGETRGKELMLSAYEDAIGQRYRFFSYGDAMLIV